MTGERFVVLGLANVRSQWFRTVGHWANSGALPADFVKCVSAEEVRARLASGRPFSAFIADAGIPALDRDLVAAAASAGCAVFVVDDGRVRRDWAALGIAKILAPDFDRDDLLTVLSGHARRIRRGRAHTGDVLTRPPPPAWRGLLAAVTGPGGTGASTAAIALAQALAGDVRFGGMVLLADLRLRGDQAMLHDAYQTVTSVQELVEAFRSGQPSSHDVRALASHVTQRNYHLLVGIRQARFWPSVRPRAFESALDGLRHAYRVVVADIDADFEGEDGGGSIDVEERNVMARTTARRADIVFAVGLPSMKGLHSLIRVVGDLTSLGVDTERIVPVLNRGPRSPRARASLASALAELSSPLRGSGASLPTPVHLLERRLEPALLDGSPLPSGLGEPLEGALQAVVGRANSSSPDGVLEAVRPGSLGRWAPEGVVG